MDTRRFSPRQWMQGASRRYNGYKTLRVDTN
jgi:hypothetical protein